MAGRMARIGMLGLAVTVLATIPVMTGAQASRYGAVANVPMAKRGWTGQGWTGPMDGPDMTRLPVDDGREAVAPPPPPVRAVSPPPLVQAVPRLRYDIPGSEHAPTQFTGRYVRPYRGWTIPTYFATSAFQVHDFQARGLAVPGQGRRWIRYYDDAVLVGPGGRVDDVRYGLDWGQPGRAVMARHAPPPERGHGPADGRMADRAYDAGYDDGYDDGHDDGAEWAADAAPSSAGWADRGSYAPGTVVTTTTPGTITTVTTVTEDVVYTRAAPRRWRAAPVRTKSWAAPTARRWSK